MGNRLPEEKNVRCCLSLMKRRGPDDRGVYRHTFSPDAHILLLHSRLSIIDLAPRANQPLKRESCVIALNGELYNYLECKAMLLKKKYSFETTSDTEVFLNMLIEYGVSGLDACEGMWAFALYNESTGELLLCRDRFGEKPLYFYRDSTGLYFGSEAKFIFALLGRKLAINFEQLYRYLVNGYKSLYKQQTTFFEQLEELKPASVLFVHHDGKVVQQKYWKPSFEQDLSLEYPEAVAQVKEALVESVRLRLRADVPLSFCMSGGVDSNALISIAKRIFHYDVHGFTIVNTDSRYTEQSLVDCSVEELGIRHTSIPLKTRDFLSNLKTLVGHHDAPVFTITYYVHWLLMESIAQQGYRISVSGTGADELFTGYFDHFNMHLYELYSSPNYYKKALAFWEQHIRPVVRNPVLKDPEAFVKNPLLRDHVFFRAGEFSEYLQRRWQEPFQETDYCTSLLRNRMYNELFHEAVPPILHEDDLNAMYFSIENRSPFLDRALFETARRIPTQYLIQEGFAKKTLRDAMKGIVPDPILSSRRKVGFNAPIFSLLDVHSKEVRRYLLNDSPIFDHVRKDKIQALLKKPNLPNSESKFLFYFLSSKMFLERFAA